MMVTGSGKCSSFGSNDAEDNGVGAWGYQTGRNPMAPYCALPAAVIGKHKLVAGQQVTVEFKGRQVRCFLADIGPSASTGRAIDLSPAVLARLKCKTDDIVTYYIDGTIVDKTQWC